MTAEGKVKEAIKGFLDSLGPDCWYFSPMMLGYGKKGVPDIIGCYRRYFFAIEVKAQGKEDAVTPWQEREIAGIKAARGVAIIASDVLWVRERFREFFGVI